MDNSANRGVGRARAEALILAAGFPSPAPDEAELVAAVERFHEAATRLNELELAGWEPVLVYRPGEDVRRV